MKKIIKYIIAAVAVVSVCIVLFALLGVGVPATVDRRSVHKIIN